LVENDGRLLTRGGRCCGKIKRDDEGHVSSLLINGGPRALLIRHLLQRYNAAQILILQELDQ
jgi:hypothetical protein